MHVGTQGVSTGVTLLVGVSVTPLRLVGVGVTLARLVGVVEVVGVDEGSGVRVAVGLGVRAARCASAVRRHSVGTASSGSANNACQSSTAAWVLLCISVTDARQ